jgi:long-chain fatty acid transport protein
VTEEGNPEYSGLTAERKELLNKFGALNQDISVDTSTPQMVFVGVFHDFQNGWSASLDASWMDFSDWGLENVTIGDSEISTKPGNYNDIWAAALGVNYKITPKITAKGGVFYVSSAQDDEERTTTMRFDQMYGAGLGFEYEYKKDRSVAIDLTYIQFGDGKFKVKDAPVVGDIEGEYTRNYGLALGIGMKW